MTPHDALLARLDKVAKRLAQSGASNDAIEVMGAAAAIRDLTAKLEAERGAREEAERRVHDLEVILNFRESLDK